MAKAPYPPFGDLRTSKNSVVKRVGGSKDEDESEDFDVEKDDEELGVSVGGMEKVDEFRRRREADSGEVGGVNSSILLKELLEGRDWAGGLAAPLTAP